MNHQQVAFRRKVIYIVSCILLLLPLVWLGQPATKKGDDSNPGGELAKLRTTHELSQASLGDIDPASATMRLGTLGLRGVAANVLWAKADEYKERKNWDKLSVTLNQLIKIQPHFVSVWEYQAHNLSYNVSVEFDDYQYRYHWVKKGIYFLIQGIPYNRKDHRILSNLGMFFGLKLGRSDESKQFRRMFRKDTDFHNDVSGFIEVERTKGPEGPDNWLASHEWYRSAEQMVANNPKVKIGGQSELMFYQFAPAQLRNYANELAKEFRPDERTRRAWAEALDAWRQFGNRKIQTSTGSLLVLNDEEEIKEKLAELRAELDELVPGVREEILNTKIAQLEPREYRAYQVVKVSPEELAAIRTNSELTPVEKRLAIRRLRRERELLLPPDERDFGLNAVKACTVSDRDVLDRASEENKAAAYRKFLEIADWTVRMQWIRNYQNQVHYSYWEVRAISEAQEQTIQARAALYDARLLASDQKYDEYEMIDPVTGEIVVDETTGEPVMAPGARQKYEESFRVWAQVFERYPDLIDETASEDMMDNVREYYRLLNGIDEEWPLEFPLQYMVDAQDMYEDTGLPTSDDLELRELSEVKELEDDSEEEPESGDSDSDDDSTPDDDPASESKSEGADANSSDAGSGDADSGDTGDSDGAGSGMDTESNQAAETQTSGESKSEDDEAKSDDTSSDDTASDDTASDDTSKKSEDPNKADESKSSDETSNEG